MWTCAPFPDLNPTLCSFVTYIEKGRVHFPVQYAFTYVVMWSKWVQQVCKEYDYGSHKHNQLGVQQRNWQSIITATLCFLRGSIFTGSAYSVVMNSGIFMPYMYLYICNILFRLIPTCTFATRSSHGVSTLLSNSQSPSQPLLSAAPYPELLPFSVPSDNFPGMHCFTTEKVSWLRGFYSM